MEGSRVEWKGVEESGGMWRRVEGGRGEWKAVEDRGCRINLMETCEVCHDQLNRIRPLVSIDHTRPPSVYIYM